MIHNDTPPIHPSRPASRMPLAPLISVVLVVVAAILVGEAASWSLTSPRAAAFASCRTAPEAAPKLYLAPPAMCIDTGRPYSAVIRTSGGNFTVALLVGSAPVTVNNFVVLAVNGYFNGTAFNRVTDWYVQGGDPTGTGAGGPGYTLPAEGGDSNWVPGSLGMARDASGINGGQFFITKGEFAGGPPTVAHNHFATVTLGFDLLARLTPDDRVLGVDVHKG